MGIATPFNTAQFRGALGRFASGVTVVTTQVTTQVEKQTHGMTANAFVSVSLDPPLVLVSLDNRSYLHRILPSTGRYGVSVLAQDQRTLSNHPAGDHTLYIGRVELFEARDDKPLLFYAGKYRELGPERVKFPESPEDEFSL